MPFDSSGALTAAWQTLKDCSASYSRDSLRAQPRSKRFYGDGMKYLQFREIVVGGRCPELVKQLSAPPSLAENDISHAQP